MILIEKAAKKYGVPEFYIVNMIESGKLQGTDEFVNETQLQALLSKKSNASADNSFFEDRPEVKIPDEDSTLEKVRIRESLAKARKAELEVAFALLPLEESEVLEAQEALARIQFEIAEVQSLQATERRSRLTLIRFDVVKQLRLVMLRIDKLQYVLQARHFVNRAQRELVGFQLNCLRTQSSILLKFLDKLMPDLKAVENTFSDDDIEEAKHGLDEIRLRVIEADHEEDFLLQ